MAMVVRTNINSMNANRNLSINNSQVATSLEKLASGYAINRAADDASGLAVSEKMKSQITGLEQASKNAEDGVSLIKVAEGACNEVHDMLNRMVELATKASNGTICDEVDREAIQAEYEVLCDEIDRISKTTNFNGIPVFEGEVTEIVGVDMSKIVNVGDFIVTGGDLDVDFKYDSVNDKIIVLTDTKLIISGSGDAIEVDDSAGSADITLDNVNIVSSKTAAFSTGNNDVKITLVGDNTLVGYVGADGSTSSVSFDGYAALNVDGNGSVTIDGEGKLTAIGGSGGSGIGGNINSDIGSIYILGGEIIATGGRSSAGIGTGYNGTLNGNITITGGDVTATGGMSGAGIGTGSGGTLNGDIIITGGDITGISARTGAGGAGIGTGSSGTINGNITITGGDVTATSQLYAAGIGVAQSGNIYGNITITGGKVTAIGSTTGAGIGTGYTNTNTIDGSIKITGGNVTAIGGIDALEDIGIGSGGTINNNYYPDTNLYNQLHEVNETTTNTGLILQVGDTNATYQKVEVPIVSMLHTSMGLGGVDLKTQESAGAAIYNIKSAINYVSKHRADLGAIQNRLEYTINNLNNTVENITTSNSKIRDTDMASEMLEYTKMGVLVQSAQSMLAQSNQAPQSILSLLG